MRSEVAGEVTSQQIYTSSLQPVAIKL